MIAAHLKLQAGPSVHTPIAVTFDELRVNVSNVAKTKQVLAAIGKLEAKGKT